MQSAQDWLGYAARHRRSRLLRHPQIDHGRDADRRHRFISSRKKHNGPTLGDYKGASLLDGTGFFAKPFCAVRRI
jgi:hypothetical protein